MRRPRVTKIKNKYIGLVHNLNCINLPTDFCVGISENYFQIRLYINLRIFTINPIHSILYSFSGPISFHSRIIKDLTHFLFFSSLLLETCHCYQHSAHLLPLPLAFPILQPFFLTLYTNLMSSSTLLY